MAGSTGEYIEVGLSPATGHYRDRRGRRGGRRGGGGVGAEGAARIVHGCGR